MALRISTNVYAASLIFGSLFLESIDASQDNPFHHQCSRFFLFGLFVLENCFVQLLFTQHWAFMSSVQTKEQAAVWFAPIAGIGSIASTAAAFTVAPLTDKFGLTPLLGLAGLFMWCSGYFAMESYRIAVQHGFEPAPKENEKKIIAKNDGKNFFQRAFALFLRVPILGALCFEVMFSQCQSSLLNSLFVLKLKEAIPADAERARYTGNVSKTLANGICDSLLCDYSNILSSSLSVVLRLHQWIQRIAPVCGSTVVGQEGRKSTFVVNHAIHHSALRTSHDVAKSP